MKKYDFGFYLTRFLTTYLPSQRGIKANTQLSYREYQGQRGYYSGNSQTEGRWEIRTHIWS